MSSLRWLLPEAIEDVLPREARQLEAMRRLILDTFAAHGYDFVMPPLLEYVESLLTGSGRDVDLQTFKLVDQLSGRSMGLRADITPQVARIDAHLLGRAGVARLCYCGSVVHTLPAGFQATREPLQIGAELYGHAGLEADIEMIRLLAEALGKCGVTASRIDLGHVRVFRALVRHAGLSPEHELEIFSALQAKDSSSLNDLLVGVAEPYRSGLCALPSLYGGHEVLGEAAKVLPSDPEIIDALDELTRLAATLRSSIDESALNFDLADLRGYHYHSGVAFAAYCAGSAFAIARGGRYDEVGLAYGRARPATGFSMDLREVLRVATMPSTKGSILVSWPEDDALHIEAERLRALGERIVLALPGHQGTWADAGCDRQLVRRDGAWLIEPLKDV
jgi:ATP phosphoribosyltransferase regulatory subunit